MTGPYGEEMKFYQDEYEFTVKCEFSKYDIARICGFSNNWFKYHGYPVDRQRKRLKARAETNKRFNRFWNK